MITKRKVEWSLAPVLELGCLGKLLKVGMDATHGDHHEFNLIYFDGSSRV